MLKLNSRQIEKISNLFMDIAKGLFLVAFTIQFIQRADLISFLRYVIGGIIFVYFSLRFTKEIKI